MCKPSDTSSAAVAPAALSDEELKTVMGVNDAWPHRGEDEGWVKSHNALRLDMKDLAETFTAVVERLEKGTAVEPWMIKNLQAYWPKYTRSVHHHHDNEEKIFFPEVNKIVQLPAKMSSDHQTLLKSLDDLTAIINGLKPGQSAADDLPVWTKLRDEYAVFKKEMEEHLDEEDNIGLPLVRKHMTHKQVKPIEDRIVKQLTPADLGWMLRAMENDKARRDWMSRIAGIPGIIQTLIMFPAAKRYRNNVAKLILDIKAGEIQPREPTNCFGM